jgi:hypothetical protein
MSAGDLLFCVGLFSPEYQVENACGEDLLGVQYVFLPFKSYLRIRSTICSFQAIRLCAKLSKTALMIFAYVLILDKNSGNSSRIRGNI